jgi:uncharacterized membrane protein
LSFDVGIFLAALGITTLEIVEAAAVGLALYAESRKQIAFLYVALGIAVVLGPTFAAGEAISLLPLVYVRIVAGGLLLYFGLRLARSARRSVVRSRKGGGAFVEEFEKGIFYTGFTVGVIEAFEAAIVLVGLLPNNYESASLGVIVGMAIVVVATFLLRSQVRKVKQANMKIFVSALLLSFSTFWFAETVTSLDDLILIPLFVVFALAVYLFANRPSKIPTVKPEEKVGPETSRSQDSKPSS